jgi:hypothetical protein
MSKPLCCFLSFLLCFSAMAEKQPPPMRVTVAQLEQVLAADGGKPDAKLALQLSGMELTERMSSARLSSWKARLPGAKAKAALVALADLSAFLIPPLAEISSDAPPETAAQQRMISMTDDYLEKTIPKLPNFFATRTTVSYQEVMPNDEQLKWNELIIGSLRSTDSSTTTVHYRDGYDFVDTAAEKGRKPNSQYSTMDTIGTFGQFLIAMVPVVANRELTWSRWELGAGGARAVFRYAVPEKNSHYEVIFCCLPEGDGTDVFKMHPGYHGEIMIDPDSGTILRLTVVADMQPKLPIARADIMVESGPVVIGGKTYICPVRSVSILRDKTVTHFQMGNEYGQQYRTFGPYMTMLDDVSFTDYHVFRSESRILTGDEPVPEEQWSNPGSTGMPATKQKTKP